MTKTDKSWTLLIILLIAAIVTGGLIIWSKYARSQPIEISLSSPLEVGGEIYISGAINSPGIYPQRSGDSLQDLLQAAGGIAPDAGAAPLRIHIPRDGEETQPQKIDLNRAEKWLLQALPEIGETRAQAIINYRQERGGFRHTSELAQVEGIGAATYEKIKHLVTVGE